MSSVVAVYRDGEGCTPPPSRSLSFNEGLFHRNGLRKITWLVDIAASMHGYVIGEKLKRYGGYDRFEKFRNFWNFDDAVG